MTQLKGAPFNAKDALLYPVEMVDSKRIAGGACTDCPFRSGNQSEMFGADDKKGRGDVCTHPSCYKVKVDTAWGTPQTST